MLALGLMSKPMLVSLPLVLILIDYWPLNRRPTFSLLVEKVPLFVLAAASSWVTLWVQARGGAVGTLEQIPLVARLSNAAVSYVAYVGKMIWPAGLAAIYPHPGAELPAWQVVGSVALLMGATVAAVRLADRFPYIAVGWLWYLVTLVPVIGIVQVGAQAMADRYAYIPLIGLFVIVAWGVPHALQARTHLAERRRVVLLGTAGGAVIAALAICTHLQLGHWRDSVALFERALQVTDHNSRAHTGLGKALAKRDRSEEALEHLREAVRIEPRFSEAHAVLAATLDLRGRSEAATTHFREALRLDPDDVATRVNFGTSLMKRGRNEEAIAQLSEAIRLDPDQRSAHKNLGVAFARRGDFDRAVSHFAKAVRIDPGDDEARRNLERARAMQRGGQ
jgi:Flp pilus assembly protein TadD